MIIEKGFGNTEITMCTGQCTVRKSSKGPGPDTRAIITEASELFKSKSYLNFYSKIYI